MIVYDVINHFAIVSWQKVFDFLFSNETQFEFTYMLQFLNESEKNFDFEHFEFNFDIETNLKLTKNRNVQKKNSRFFIKWNHWNACEAIHHWKKQCRLK